MKSVTIEYLRFGATEGLLRQGDNYILTAGFTRPAKEILMPFHERDFRKKLKSLRYPGDDENGAGASQALQQLSADVSKILSEEIVRRDLESDDSVQLDIVTSASELWALPFETLYSTDSFNLDHRNVIITRRIRQDNIREEDPWTEVPRILFVSAHPDWLNAEKPPVNKHKTALQEALKPWVYPMEIENYEYILPDYSRHLTVLENATLEDLKKAIDDARDDVPYTHVHILAHGILDPEADMFDRQYGLALNSDSRQVVTPDQLVEILKPFEGSPHCITLAVCDGGNQVNPVRPGSLAQALHVQGTPVVVASQLPLTMEGSGEFTEVFYKNLLKGEDVRSAIHEGRKALFASETDHHDFVSVVGYIQLPEGYTNFLQRLKLRSQFAQVNVLRKWVQHVIGKSGFNEQTIRLARDQFHTHIDSVEDYYKALVASKSFSSSLFEEMTGLLGSAYKTLAELEFYYAQDSGKDDHDLPEKYLAKASMYYREGFKLKYTAHWNGLQYISLDIVTNGAPDRSIYWDIVELIATEATEDSEDYWAYGTLVELYLMASIVKGEDMLDQSQDALLKFLDCITEKEARDFAMSSLTRQLQKYADWWTIENGYFPGCQQDLSADATKLIQLLNKYENAK